MRYCTSLFSLNIRIVFGLRLVWMQAHVARTGLCRARLGLVLSIALAPTLSTLWCQSPSPIAIKAKEAFGFREGNRIVYVIQTEVDTQVSQLHFGKSHSAYLPDLIGLQIQIQNP
jgi:hypothetical protein